MLRRYHVPDGEALPKIRNKCHKLVRLDLLGEMTGSFAGPAKFCIVPLHV